MADRTKSLHLTTRPRRQAAEPATDLHSLLSGKVIGQPAAMDRIVPYVQLFQAGLAPEGRPVGVFLLLGPTGTGKTKTVEALAETLHGSSKNVLKVDCGEFQLDHEVAKLIGAPPGYLGHRETQPVLSQHKLNASASEGCGLSIVLFDEIEKAAPSMNRLLLGVLDKATLRLGDNTSVNFERSLIFLTSNLGAREMMKEIAPDFGFAAGVAAGFPGLEKKLGHVGMQAVRKKFSPEFVNRIDCIVTYLPLSDESLWRILDHQIFELQRHVNHRLGPRGFTIQVPKDSREFLLREGASREYGARELNRTIHRTLTQPLAAMVAGGRIEPGATVRARLSRDGASLVLEASGGGRPDPPGEPGNRVLSYLETLIGAEDSACRKPSSTSTWMRSSPRSKNCLTQASSAGPLS